jgi:hypothetical protein
MSDETTPTNPPDLAALVEEARREEALDVKVHGRVPGVQILIGRLADTLEALTERYRQCDTRAATAENSFSFAKERIARLEETVEALQADRERLTEAASDRARRDWACANAAARQSYCGAHDGAHFESCEACRLEIAAREAEVQAGAYHTMAEVSARIDAARAGGDDDAYSAPFGSRRAVPNMTFADRILLLGPDAWVVPDLAGGPGRQYYVAHVVYDETGERRTVHGPRAATPEAALMAWTPPNDLLVRLPPTAAHVARIAGHLAAKEIGG